MPRFQVVEGVHVGDDGRRYKKDDVVNSPHDLAATFRGKFRRMDTVQSVAEEVGRQVGGPGPSGPTFVPPTGSAPVPEVPEEEDDAETAPGTAEGPVEPGKPKGTNQTAKFPTAKEQDYSVYKSGGLFYVYDNDDLNKPINETGVAKGGVEKVITDALKK